MPALDAVEWETCLLEPVHNPAAERALRKALGVVPPGFTYFLDSAWGPAAAIAFDLGHLPLRHLSSKVAEMVALVVSQDNACRYCFNMTRGVLGILGFSDARIRRLEEDLRTAELDAAELAALQFARRVSRAAPPVGLSDVAPLRALGCSNAAIAELAAVAAINVFYNRTATLPALPYQAADELFRRPTVRLFGPLVRRWMRPRRRRAPTPLAAEARVGPFAPFVTALEGLPVAPRLHTVIRACLHGSTLGPRATAMVFAVVARGIGCAVSEREATQLLLADGMPEHDIEPALAHLAAPSLGPLERAVAALARDSVWPQPASLQRHARTIRPLFTPQQFVDLIGVAALANALCRLSIAVDLAPPSA